MGRRSQRPQLVGAERSIRNQWVPHAHALNCWVPHTMPASDGRLAQRPTSMPNPLAPLHVRGQGGTGLGQKKVLQNAQSLLHRYMSDGQGGAGFGQN